MFFPSFAMLDKVYELFVMRYYDNETQYVIGQAPYMTEKDREDFINHFTGGYEDKTLVGFCVLGGIFSEGIDLKGDSLIGAIIIGTGLPMVCPERQMLKDRYDEMGVNGFDYAYKYPGMNKVEQAAGRVIRTENDKGVVALLDERFLGRDYKSMFPREWNNNVSVRVDDIEEYLDDFWGNEGT